MDSKKGYYPASYCVNSPAYTIYFPTIPPMTFTPQAGGGTYWMYFLAPYVSHTKFGSSRRTTAQDVSNSMSSILWGCPNFVPVVNTVGGEGTVNGIATVYTGYGMNAFPEYTAQYPASNAMLGDSGPGTGPNVDPLARNCLLTTPDNWHTIASGKWYTYKDYTNPAEKALVGDCRFYVLEATGVKPAGSFIGQENFLSIGLGGGAWVGGGGPNEGEASYDFYRHGKYPPVDQREPVQPQRRAD